MGATAHLVPPDQPWHDRLVTLWRYAVLPMAAFDAAIAIGTPWLIDPDSGSPGPMFWVHVIIVAIIAFDALIALFIARGGLDGPYGWLLLAGGILFGLSVTSAAMPHAISGSPIWSIVVGYDLILLGVAIAAYDAFDTGERLGPHMIRSGRFRARAGSVRRFAARRVWGARRIVDTARRARTGCHRHAGSRTDGGRSGGSAARRIAPGRSGASKGAGASLGRQRNGSSDVHLRAFRVRR